MSYITKKIYLENREVAEQLSWKIAEILTQTGNRIGNNISLAAYLLYKVSLYNNPLDFSVQKIANEIENNNVSLLVKESITDETWERLKQLLTKYSSDQFAVAAAMQVNENEMKSGTMTTPESILKLIQMLLNVTTNDKVADICCGGGNYFVSAALEEPNASYYGYELNSENATIAQMRAELIDAEIEVSLCDVFALANDNNIVKFDKIFAGYPFGLKLKNLGAGADYLERLAEQYPGLSKATSSDWVFNALVCDLLSTTGKAIGIMTNGSTWNSIDTPMRKYFVERKMVECVISLPSKMFSSTSIATTLIVLSHDNDNVRMIDATKLCQQGRRQNEFSNGNIADIVEALSVDTEYSREVSIEELRDNEYVLSLSRYINNDIEFANGVPFESVIKSITRGAPCTAKQLDEMVSDDVTNMQYLMLSNIQNGIIDDNLPHLSYIDAKFEKYCLKNNSLILSKNGYPYKVAVAKVNEGQRILANGNLYIIELEEEKANPYYIKAFFDSEQGNAVLKSITVGTTIPNIGVDKLKKVMIPLPSMEEQNRIAQKYQATLDEIAVIKLRLEKAINRLHHICDEECD